MKIYPTALPGVLRLQPDMQSDVRGWFSEIWNPAAVAHLGLPAQFAQENQSRSARGVLRGMHFQMEHPQGKLVRVTAGRVFDVAVDVRPSSPNFGNWVGVELNCAAPSLLWIPPGFAHGFLALTVYADVVYKTTDIYHPESERVLYWADPTVGIRWPDGGPTIMSAKDAAGVSLLAAVTK